MPKGYDRVVQMQRYATVQSSTWELSTPFGYFRVSFSYEKDLAARRIIVKRLAGASIGTRPFGNICRYGVSNTAQRPCKNMAYVAINWFLNDEERPPKPKGPKNA